VTCHRDLIAHLRVLLATGGVGCGSGVVRVDQLALVCNVRGELNGRECVCVRAG
jgi:hypothetical protein